MLKSTGKLVDDESMLLEKSRQDIHLVISCEGNVKIRTSKELERAIANANGIHH